MPCSRGSGASHIACCYVRGHFCQGHSSGHSTMETQKIWKINYSNYKCCRLALENTYSPMKTLLTYSRQLLLALGLAAVQSCAHRPAELPVPVPTTASGLSVSEAQAWYQDTYPGAAIATGSNQLSSVTATAGGTSTAAELAWSRALTVGKGAQQLVLVPLAGDEALFAHTKYAGPRYLIVAKTANNVLEGNVLELLLPRSATSLDTLGLFTSLTVATIAAI